MMSQVVRTNKPVIDDIKCIKCGVCQRFCPEATMLLHEDRVIVDLRYCKGCGICANECPVGAIKMMREN
jgi:2-oxoisovalerate ferredoxin oxidoreductase delta subunit